MTQKQLNSLLKLSINNVGYLIAVTKLQALLFYDL